MSKNFFWRLGTNASIWVMFGVGLSRLIGFWRMRLLSTTLGAGAGLDAYLAAFRLPDLIASIFISGTVSVALIPVFTRMLEKDAGQAFGLARFSMLFVSALTAVSGIFLIVFADSAVKISAPGFSAETAVLAASLLRLVSLAQIFLAASVVVAAILQALRIFFWAALAPVFYNLGIIFGIVFLYPKFGVLGLGFGVVLGAVLHLFVQVPSLLRAYKKSRQKSRFVKLTVSLESIKQLGKIYFPRLVYLDLGQAGLFMATYFASRFVAGSVGVYTFAYDIVLVPVGVLAGAIVTTAYPNLSLSANTLDKTFFRILKNATLQIFGLMFFSSFFLYAFRNLIVEILLGGKAFGYLASQETAAVLAVLAVGLPFFALVPLFTRAYFALYRTWVPLLVGWLAILCYIVVASLVAVNPVGLAWAFVFSSIFACGALGFWLFYISRAYK